MQMTISTTGRRQLCILCSVCVLSKMLKLCGAEGSSFRWLMGAGSCSVSSIQFLKWISVLSSILFVGGAPDRSACDAVVRLWLMHSVVVGCCQLFVTEAASVCWSSIGATVRDTIFGCCQPLSVGIHQTFGFWSGSVRCWDLSDFVSEVDLFLLNSVLCLAFRHWHWYHNLLVTIVRFLGSLMAQGSVLGWMRQLLRSIRLLFLRWVSVLKHHLLLVTMS